MRLLSGFVQNIPNIHSKGDINFCLWLLTTAMLVVLVRYLRICCAEILDHLPLFMSVPSICDCIFWLVRAICGEPVILMLTENCSWSRDYMQVYLNQVFIFNNVYTQKNILLLKTIFWESCYEIITEFVLCKTSN